MRRRDVRSRSPTQTQEPAHIIYIPTIPTYLHVINASVMRKHCKQILYKTHTIQVICSLCVMMIILYCLQYVLLLDAYAYDVLKLLYVM